MKRLLTLFSLSVVYGAVAQTSYITFDDALSLAFERNPAIVASELTEQAAHRERQAAIGLFMPQVSIKGTYAHFNKDIKIDLNPMVSSFLPILGEGLSSLGLDFSYPLQRRNTAFLGGDVVMPIFAGGRIWSANRAAKINEERAQVQSRQVRGALMVEVVERYFGTELARQVVAIREEAVMVVKHHLNDVVVAEREGMAVESERLYAEYRLAEAERDLRRAELQLQTAQQALMTSLGSGTIPLPSTPMFLLDKIEPLEYFVAMAEEHNPQLVEVEKLRELARVNLRLHRAEFFPEIAAMGGMIFCNNQLSSLVPRAAVGVGFNFKLFDGLNREYRYSAARLQLRRVAALEEKAARDIALLIEKLYNEVEAILTTLSAVERSESFAEEYLRAKQSAYRESMATTTDVVDAALSLSRAKLERVQTAYEFDLALARLLEASGMGDSFLQYLHRQTAKSIF